jgi:hypothetical protein
MLARNGLMLFFDPFRIAASKFSRALNLPAQEKRTVCRDATRRILGNRSLELKQNGQKFV